MDIPRYPDSRPLDLTDKPLFDRWFAALRPRISEFTFAGLYLFRQAHGYRLTMVEKVPTVLGQGYAGGSYFLPPLEGDLAGATRILLDGGLTLYGADEQFLPCCLTGNYVAQEDRDNFDYLYLKVELAELPGNRFHKKKNRVNYFTRRHDYRVELYADQHRDEALALLDEWRRVRGEIGSRSLDPEAAAGREALELAGELGLAGVVVLVAGKVKAFALGERLNPDTSVCHFEKADPFMEGLSQLVDREFNRLLFTDCTWVNREQDLGEPGLREAKLSYHPVELVKKYRVRRVAP